MSLDKKPLTIEELEALRDSPEWETRYKFIYNIQKKDADKISAAKKKISQDKADWIQSISDKVNGTNKKKR